MKMIRTVVALALLLASVPASAQWQTPNHSVPIGRGAGVTGFGSAVPAIAGRPFVDNGVSADPSFGTIGNAGFTTGPANTVKGTLDGVSTTDLPLPDCTGVNQAWRYASGVGINCGTVSVNAGYDAPINLGLSASAAGGALTINITQANGSVPTSTNPVLAAFRSLTATIGTAAYSTISAVTSITIPSGATLGTSSSNVPFRLWIFLTANGGTPAVAVAVCSNTTTIFPCASWEYTLKTSVTISAGAGSGGVLYATAGVTLDAVRIVGFCDFATGLGTAGSWASSCTTLQVFGPGIKKPGETVQTVYSPTTTSGSTTSATYAALTSGHTASITVTAAPNLVRMGLQGVINNAGGAADNFLRVVRGSTQIGTPLEFRTTSATQTSTISLIGYDQPGVGLSTYTVQGKTDTGTLTYPVSATGSNIELQEIMG